MDCTEDIIFGSSDSETESLVKFVDTEKVTTPIMARTKQQRRSTPLKRKYECAVKSPVKQPKTPEYEPYDLTNDSVEPVEPTPRARKTREEYKKLYRDCRIAYLDVKDLYDELETKFKENCERLNLVEEINDMQDRRRKFETNKLLSKLRSCLDSNIFN